jgi:hypothetical protein
VQKQSKLFDAAAQRNGSSTKIDPLDADRLALFRLMHDAFIEAEHQAGGSDDYYYKIGGSVLRLRFAGPALVQFITRAFAHLAVAPVPIPDLTICLWDSVSTGRQLPLLVSSLIRLLKITWLEDRGIRGEILDYNSGRIRAALHGHDNTILSLIDLQERTAVYWVQTGSDIPWYETGAPLRILLYWWFSHHAKQIIHGGAIGTERGGLLLGGKGGSGKSTTALACLDSALLYAGDDYSLVELSSQPFVHSLYNTAKVKGEADLNRFPWMSSRICNVERIGPDAEKPMMFLHEHQPDKITSGFPLKAVVLPRFFPGTKKCEVTSLAPESAFRAIAHSTITQLAGAGSEALRAMSQIVHRVPCYLVKLGEDLSDISKTMSELLERQP